MNDKIFIRNLRLSAILGILPHERVNKQEIVVNLVAESDVSKPGKSDDFRDAIDYRIIRDKVAALVAESGYFLAEKLAEKIAETVLGINGITRVTVTVEKPEALESCDSVGVEITREK